MSETEQTITIPIQDAARMEKATAAYLRLATLIEKHVAVEIESEQQRSHILVALLRTQVALERARWMPKA